MLVDAMMLEQKAAIARTNAEASATGSRRGRGRTAYTSEPRFDGSSRRMSSIASRGYVSRRDHGLQPPEQRLPT